MLKAEVEMVKGMIAAAVKEAKEELRAEFARAAATKPPQKKQG